MATTYNFNTKNKIAQRLSMLYTNIEALINRYYALYMLDADEELTVQQYDDTACIIEGTIPNRNLVLNESVYSGATSPQGVVEATCSQVYINTADKSVWVCLVTGKDNWMRVFTSKELEDHNYDEKAHEGIIALVAGDSANYFHVRDVKSVTYNDYREGLNYYKIGHPTVTMDGLANNFTTTDYIVMNSLDPSSNDFGFDVGLTIKPFDGYRMYAWLCGDTNYYTLSATPVTGDRVYDSTGTATTYTVATYSPQTGIEIDYNTLHA